MVARVAQLVEHTLGKGEVIGSIPIASLQVGGSNVVAPWGAAWASRDTG